MITRIAPPRGEPNCVPHERLNCHSGYKFFLAAGSDSNSASHIWSTILGRPASGIHNHRPAADSRQAGSFPADGDDMRMTDPGAPAPARRPAMLLLGAAAGMALLAGLLYLFHSVLTMPESATPPGAATPATRPAATAPSPHARKWLTGLTALQTRMNNAGPPSGVAVTPRSLHVTAVNLSRCTPDLTRLGPPPSPLRAVYRQARHACASFEQAAKCYAATARRDLHSAQAGKQLASCADDTDYASALLGAAVADGSAIVPGT
jgi:hypothetical protein